MNPAGKAPDVSDLSDASEAPDAPAAVSASAAAPLQAAYTLNGSPVARERFYALACDPARSVVVEACAGAGKTWMLVSRILRALLEGTPPQDIVAITFTRKAAGEMRQRLNEWLHEFAHCDHAGRVVALRQRGLSEAQAQALAADLRALQQRLLQGARAVEIRTFHAWFSQLLRAAPLELLQAQGLSPELQLIEDESDLMPELWQRFHAAVLEDEASLADYQQLSLAHGRNKLLGWLAAAFDKRVEIRLAHQHGRLLDSMPGPEDVVPELAAFDDPMQAFAPLRPALQQLAIAWGTAKNATPRKAATAIEMALQLGDDEALAAIRQAIFTAEGTPRKNLGDDPALMAVVDRLQRLQLAIDQGQARAWHRQMCGLALQLLDQFDALKRERGLVDMNDLERGALALLGDAALSGWVQEKLDSQVRHLLIDEFQDTSPLQWHALYAWLSSYVGAGGGASGQRPPSVFIVGDPKQSIYRFRRAEPRVFAAARDFVREGLDGVLLACDHTRRNSPQVLAAVNAVFESATLAQQYSGFRAHTTESGDGHPLDGVFHIADDGPEEAIAGSSREEGVWRPSLTQARREPELHRREAEACRIAAAISQLLSGGQVLPGDIFVLARKRDGLRVLAQVLKAQGIAHAAPEDMPLLEAPDVRDLLALLDVLASNGHNLSLAHALRSPLFGASEADLLTLAAASNAVRWLKDADDAAADEDDRPASDPDAELDVGLSEARLEGVDGRDFADAEVAMIEAQAVGERPSEPMTLDLFDPPPVPAMETPAAAPASADDSRSWWDALMQSEAEALSPALCRARTLLQRWNTLAIQRSPHDLLDAIVHEGDLMARIAAAVPTSERRARLHAVEALLALALELDGGRYSGLYGFVRSLKGRALKLGAPAEPDAVQLLTVHGAKGLEARVVIMMDAEAGPARAEHMALAIAWPVHEPVPRTVAFIVSETRPPPSLQALLDDEKEQRQREELNALYVAMTRARSQLLLSRTPAKRVSSTATWWTRVQPLATPVVVPPLEEGGSASEGETALLRQLPQAPPRVTPEPSEQVGAASDAAGLGQGPEAVDDSAALGEALHRVLEWHSGPQGRAHPLERLMAAAAQMYGLDARRDERLQRSVQAILGSDACAPFFDADQLLWQGNEVPLSWRDLDMRLDRLVCRRDGADAVPTWWVLDYKLHPAPQNNPEYLAQLWRYREAVRALQPDEPVRCAFITGQGRLIDCTERVISEFGLEPQISG
ncbi:UvrD-helicase domain-containing protein [Roseateles amylovorans]|uniref:DNA 3'-5' helicase n=1 Tax=Roseateles amylovorans TaxID=2978473 RepID=A0ABY6AXE6_9BURK|nr:UvrD-helicase domain-containing protein [Roseateles amylovorans]UXH76429.1 UvrD-helicase domain-containing protein [Roseateles amylovorans]